MVRQNMLEEYAIRVFSLHESQQGQTSGKYTNIPFNNTTPQMTYFLQLGPNLLDFPTVPSNTINWGANL
jgi:hypothetical protein